MQRRRTITGELLGVGALALLFTLSACDKGAGEGEGEVKAEANVEAAAEANAEANAEVEGEARVAVVAEARVAGDVTIKSADFELEVVSQLIKEGEIESAAELEVVINDEARGINHVDIDADGTIDHIQVVEVRGPTIEVDGTVDAEVDAEVGAEISAEVEVDGTVDAEVEGVAGAVAEAAAEVKVEAAAVADADVVFELRAIPSSSAKAEAAVSFASAGFVTHEAEAELEIRAVFHAVVPQPEVTIITHRVPVSFEASAVVGGAAFFTWVYAPQRVAYVGTYEVDTDGHWIPPGHRKHGHWKATGDGPPGHGERGSVHAKASAKHQGKGKHSGGGVFDVKVSRGKKKGKASGSLKGSLGGSARGDASASAKGGKSKGGKSKGGKSKGAKSKGAKSKKK